VPSELALLVEPMFGHGPFTVPDLWVGAGLIGALGVVVLVLGVVLEVVVESLLVVVLAVVPVDADAPAMPAAAPPVASAPATMVAPSILEIRMGWNLLGMFGIGLMCCDPSCARALSAGVEARKDTRRRT
jgi:hypothetical protein